MDVLFRAVVDANWTIYVREMESMISFAAR